MDKIKKITPKSKKYPKLLQEIHQPPALFIRGNLKPKHSKAVAVVGTRKMSSYGQQITPKIVSQLVNAGLTIVSGLALGIDALAHKTALKHNGDTIAVLGCGVDDKTIYPRQNLKLAQKIIKSGQGAIISEFAPKTSPRKEFFPQRNRIISGLSLATIVIEAPIKSGALITARLALEQNRDVFALPGSIFWSNSAGCNALIRDSKAKLLTNAQEVINELYLGQRLNLPQENKKPIGDNKKENLILSQLSQDPLHIDKIKQATKMPINELNALLCLMEIKGKVKNTGQSSYVLGGI